MGILDRKIGKTVFSTANANFHSFCWWHMTCDYERISFALKFNFGHFHHQYFAEYRWWNRGESYARIQLALVKGCMEICRPKNLMD